MGLCKGKMLPAVAAAQCGIAAASASSNIMTSMATSSPAFVWALCFAALAVALAALSLGYGTAFSLIIHALTLTFLSHFIPASCKASHYNLCTWCPAQRDRNFCLSCKDCLLLWAGVRQAVMRAWSFMSLTYMVSAHISPEQSESLFVC